MNEAAAAVMLALTGSGLLRTLINLAVLLFLAWWLQRRIRRWKK